MLSVTVTATALIRRPMQKRKKKTRPSQINLKPIHHPYGFSGAAEGGK